MEVRLWHFLCNSINHLKIKPERFLYIYQAILIIFLSISPRKKISHGTIWTLVMLCSPIYLGKYPHRTKSASWLKILNIYLGVANTPNSICHQVHCMYRGIWVSFIRLFWEIYIMHIYLDEIYVYVLYVFAFCGTQARQCQWRFLAVLTLNLTWYMFVCIEDAIKLAEICRNIVICDVYGTLAARKNIYGSHFTPIS